MCPRASFGRILARFLAAAALMAACGPACTFGKSKPFPSEILAAKTISVVANYGLRSTALDPVKGQKFKNDAEAVLRDSGRFTLVDDPAKSDLVLLLVGGYSPGAFGFREYVATGVVFSGGAHPGWIAVPLWIEVQAAGLRTRAAAAAITKTFLKEVSKAEQSASGTSGSAVIDDEKDADHNATQSQADKDAAPATEDVRPHSLPVELLQAKTVMVIARMDPAVGPQGEQREKSVEKELVRWGRFVVVNDSASADLIIVCVPFVTSDAVRAYETHVYENMLVFKGHSQKADWSKMPLWTAMQIDAPLARSPGAQMVRWLGTEIENQEKQSAAQAPNH